MNGPGFEESVRDDQEKSEQSEKGQAMPAEEIPRGGKADPGEGLNLNPAD